MSDNGMKWYTIHVYSSMEKSVKKALEERIGRSDLRESFGQVSCPLNAFRKSATVASTLASAACTPATSSSKW